MAARDLIEHAEDRHWRRRLNKDDAVENQVPEAPDCASGQCSWTMCRIKPLPCVSSELLFQPGRAPIKLGLWSRYTRRI
jgi:hypothetical protein